MMDPIEREIREEIATRRARREREMQASFVAAVALSEEDMPTYSGSTEEQFTQWVSNGAGNGVNSFLNDLNNYANEKDSK